MTTCYSIPTLTAKIEDLKRRHEETLKENIERVEAYYQAVQLLDGEGFPLNLSQWDNGWLEVPVKRDELPKVRQTLGVMRVSGRQVHNARKKEVKVSLSPAAFPNITVTYVCKLKDGGRCKLTKHKEKRAQRTRYHLECSL